MFIQVGNSLLQFFFLHSLYFFLAFKSSLCRIFHIVSMITMAQAIVLT